MVSSSVLPSSGGSSVIVENLAKNFHKDELIVLGARGLSKPKFHREKSFPRFIYFFSELSFFGRGARFFNWFRNWRQKTLQKFIQKLLINESVDCVIGVYPNIQYCLAACRAAKETGRPFFAYFHNTYVENKAITDANAERFQKEIFDNSVSIFVMSDGMKRVYERLYPKYHFEPLVHTFDQYPEKKESNKLSRKQGPYRLVAIGNFNESNLEATRRFLDAVKEDDRFEIYFYTHVPRILLQERGLKGHSFHHMGSVNPDQIHDVIAQYDFCLLTHGFSGAYGEIEYESIFPTRTIPFLLSGRPIVAHVPESSFIHEFLNRHECAALISRPEKSAIIDELERLIADENYQDMLTQNAQKTARQFYGPTVVAKLKEKLSI